MGLIFHKPHYRSLLLIVKSNVIIPRADFRGLEAVSGAGYGGRQSTGAGSANSPSRRTSTMPEVPVETWPTSGKNSIHKIFQNDDKRSSQLIINETKTPFQNH